MKKKLWFLTLLLLISYSNYVSGATDNMILTIRQSEYNITLNNCKTTNEILMTLSWNDVGADSYVVAAEFPAGKYVFTNNSQTGVNRSTSVDLSNEQWYDCLIAMSMDPHIKHTITLNVTGTYKNGSIKVAKTKVSIKPEYDMTLKDYYMRDPFVTVDRENKCYYLIMSDLPRLKGLESGDIEHWKSIGNVFDPPVGFLGTNDYWAPDTYKYKGEYYTFVTMSNTDKGIIRGTTILKSISGAAGPYKPVLSLDRLNFTPSNMQCLDGSLYVDDDGTPWMIFSLEWDGPNVSNHVGEVWAMKLKDDLSDAAGAPFRLFKASEASWIADYAEFAKVVDAPFIWRDDASGNLILVWSSFVNLDTYGIGQAISTNGLKGPWKHENEPVYKNDGGHQMIFRDLNGLLRIAFHTPNKGNERLQIRDLQIINGKIVPLK